MGRKGGAGGYLTVYVALSLTVLLALFLAILEGTRYHTMLLESEIIADIAADSVLAEYHREMLNQYGMFWVDTSYGSSEPAVEKLREHLEWYAGKNCTIDDVFLGEYLYKDFLDMKLAKTAVLSVAVASDGSGFIFRERAVEVVKDDIGIGFLENVKQWLETVEYHGLDQSTLEQEKEQADSEIAELNGQKKQVGEQWVTIEVDNPTIPIEELRRKGVLQLVLDNPEEVSTRGIDLSRLIGQRRAQEGLNQGNWEVAEEGAEEGLMDRLLWQEYLMRYCGFYGQELEKSALQYQVEYLIVGKDNDTDNLKGVIHRLCAIREAANALYLFADELKCAEAEAAAALIAAAIALPEAQPVFKVVILLGWAYAESLYDVRCLLEGSRVPLLKTADNWHYDIGAILEGVDADIGAGGSEGNQTEAAEAGAGLSYADYLRLLLALSPLEEQTFRMMDVVEMDIRQTAGNTSFRLDGCVDRLEVEMVIESSYGYRVEVQKTKQY